MPIYADYRQFRVVPSLLYNMNKERKAEKSLLIRYNELKRKDRDSTKVIFLPLVVYLWSQGKVSHEYG